jgi:hypothetical protein
MDVTPPKPPTVRLSSAWAKVTVVAWIIVMAALIAVVVTGRNVGKPAWWIGPESSPSFFLLWIAPFVFPLWTILLAFRSSRFVPIVGVVASVVAAGFAAGDIVDSPGVALVMGVVALSGLCVALATFAGLERR